MELQHCAKRAEELAVENSCLAALREPGNKLQSTVLDELHEGHLEVNQMTVLVRSYVWWLTLDRDIEDVVRSCRECQDSRNKTEHTMSHPMSPEGPWIRIHEDFAEWGGTS